MIVFHSNPPADGTAPGGRPFARGNQIYSIAADGSDLTRLNEQPVHRLAPVWWDTRPAIYNDVWGSAAVLFPGSFRVTSEDFLVRSLS